MVHVDEPDTMVGILELMVLAVGREVGIRSLGDSRFGKLGAGASADSNPLNHWFDAFGIANPRSLHAFPDLPEQVFCGDRCRQVAYDAQAVALARGNEDMIVG